MKFLKFISLLASFSIFISCSGGGGGSSSSSVSGHFASGYSGSYNNSTANSWTNNTEFDGVLYTGSVSGRTTTQNPYEVMNIHKAYGYGLSGNGYYIHVQDDRIDQNHMEWSGKTISNYQNNYTTDINSNADGNYWHGAAVASVALGAYNNNSEDDIMGVAYNADLYYSDYDTLNSGVSDYSRDYALALDGSPSSTAASNHSYGVVGTNIQTVINYKNNNSLSNAETVAAYMTAAGLTSSTSNSQMWLDSLNSFQANKGVVVWALSNDTSHTEAHWMAGLPQLETSLQDAWITVGTVDIQGSSGNESYTSVYSDCGSTAAYCVVTDSYGVNFASYENSLISGIDEDGSSSYYSAGTGNSFGAPMIAGSVTLLKEAFPNLTPAQITDRLLATADNTFFTTTATVDFGNGVKHGYNTEFGHGIPDVYKALQPITSSMLSESIFVGESLDNKVAHDLDNSFIQTPKVFGDSLKRHFDGKSAVFHDALYGSFKYDFASSFISYDQYETIEQKLSNHLNSYSFKTYVNEPSSPFESANSFIAKYENIDGEIKINPNSFSNFTNFGGQRVYNSMNVPIEISTGFISNDISANVIYNEGFSNPFIPSDSFAIGSLIGLNSENNHLALSFYDNSINNIDTPNSGIVVTKKIIDKDNTNSSLMFGLGLEHNSFIGSNSSGAFNQNNNTPTIFVSHSFEKKISKSTDISLISSLGRTQYNNSSSNTLINNISPIISSSFGALLKHDLNSNDSFIIKVYQPHRLESGTANISVPLAHDVNGTLNFNQEKVDLHPSGRQIDLSFRYNKSIENNISLSFENITSSDEGHVSSNKLNNTSIVSMSYSF